MPLYEYQCQRCHRRVEKIQSFTAPPLTTCEACGGPLEKLISLSAFQFKGAGWYVTDYAKKPGVSPAPHEASGNGEQSPSSDGGESGTGGGASESKPESKSESKADKTGKSATPAATATAAPAAAPTPQK